MPSCPSCSSCLKIDPFPATPVQPLARAAAKSSAPSEQPRGSVLARRPSRRKPRAVRSARSSVWSASTESTFARSIQRTIPSRPIGTSRPVAGSTTRTRAHGGTACRPRAPPRVGLAGKLAHAVLVPDGIVRHLKSLRQSRVKFRLGNLPRTALEPARLQQSAARRQGERRRQGIEKMDEPEGCAAKCHRTARARQFTAQGGESARIQGEPRASSSRRALPETEHGAERGVGCRARGRRQEMEIGRALEKARPPRSLHRDRPVEIASQQMLPSRLAGGRAARFVDGGGARGAVRENRLVLEKLLRQGRNLAPRS